jgi:hypothetical protein
MLDTAGPGLKQVMNNKTDGMLANAPFTFAPADGVGYFEGLGWRVVEVESVFDGARRFHRLPWPYRLVANFHHPDARRPPQNRPWSAVIRLTRQSDAT